MNAELVSHSCCGPFFHREGQEAHPNQMGPSCWELQVSLPPGKDSTVKEALQKTKTWPFQQLRRFLGEALGTAAGSDLEKVKQASEAALLPGAGGAGAAIKEILCLRDRLAFLVEQTGGPGFILHSQSRERRGDSCWRVKRTSPRAGFHLPQKQKPFLFNQLLPEKGLIFC